jgi:hypothetical protein
MRSANLQGRYEKFRRVQSPVQNLLYLLVGKICTVDTEHVYHSLKKIIKALLLIIHKIGFRSLVMSTILSLKVCKMHKNKEGIHLSTDTPVCRRQMNLSGDLVYLVLHLPVHFTGSIHLENKISHVTYNF